MSGQQEKFTQRQLAEQGSTERHRVTDKKRQRAAIDLTVKQEAVELYENNFGASSIARFLNDKYESVPGWKEIPRRTVSRWLTNGKREEIKNTNGKELRKRKRRDSPVQLLTDTLDQELQEFVERGGFVDDAKISMMAQDVAQSLNYHVISEEETNRYVFSKILILKKRSVADCISFFICHKPIECKRCGGSKCGGHHRGGRGCMLR